MATLIIKNPDGSEQEQELAESLSVGRSEGNDLILSEGGVSRRHARFFVEGQDMHEDEAQRSMASTVIAIMRQRHDCIPVACVLSED